MINLGSLSALIRTLRRTSGIDGPVAAVARIAAVAAVAEDDAGAMTSTATRPSPWARVQPNPMGPPAGAQPRHADLRGQMPVHATRVPAAVPSRSQPAANGAATGDEQSSALDFTVGARLLQAAFRSAGFKTPVPPMISSPMPLAPSSSGSPQVLAEGLATAVAGSGLFYESHLARALQRDYPAAALSREPQSAWPASPAEASTASNSNSALSEAASTMLTKQLDLLDTRSLVWNGDVWPGQRATIGLEEAIEDHGAANDADGTSVATTWHMRVTLDLPSLGRVQATLGLRGESLDLALAATSEDTQARLASAKAELAAALGDTQLAIARFDIEVVPDA